MDKWCVKAVFCSCEDQTATWCLRPSCWPLAMTMNFTLYTSSFKPVTAASALPVRRSASHLPCPCGRRRRWGLLTGYDFEPSVLNRGQTPKRRLELPIPRIVFPQPERWGLQTPRTLVRKSWCDICKTEKESVCIHVCVCWNLDESVKEPLKWRQDLGSSLFFLHTSCLIPEWFISKWAWTKACPSSAAMCTSPPLSV